jgi:hypothetical protein
MALVIVSFFPRLVPNDRKKDFRPHPCRDVSSKSRQHARLEPSERHARVIDDERAVSKIEFTIADVDRRRLLARGGSGCRLMGFSSMAVDGIQAISDGRQKLSGDEWLGQSGLSGHVVAGTGREGVRDDHDLAPEPSRSTLANQLESAAIRMANVHHQEGWLMVGQGRESLLDATGDDGTNPSLRKEGLERLTGARIIHHDEHGHG